MKVPQDQLSEALWGGVLGSAVVLHRWCYRGGCDCRDHGRKSPTPCLCSGDVSSRTRVASVTLTSIRQTCCGSSFPSHRANHGPRPSVSPAGDSYCSLLLFISGSFHSPVWLLSPSIPCNQCPALISLCVKWVSCSLTLHTQLPLHFHASENPSPESIPVPVGEQCSLSFTESPSSISLQRIWWFAAHNQTVPWTFLSG